MLGGKGVEEGGSLEGEELVDGLEGVFDVAVKHVLDLALCPEVKAHLLVGNGLLDDCPAGAHSVIVVVENSQFLTRDGLLVDVGSQIVDISACGRTYRSRH